MGLVHTLKHEARYRYSLARHRLKTAVEHRRKRRLMLQWIGRLRSKPPDVLVGANIDERGGLRNHLLGIRRFSALRVEFAPPDDLREILSYSDFHTAFRKEFLGFAPTRIPCIHSHVYPYFTEWCKSQADSGTRWVHTYHSPYFPTFEGDTLEPWQNEINHSLLSVARHAHVRISVSRWQQKWLASEHGIATTYIPNGVDVEATARGDASRFAGRFGGGPFVLYLGRDDAVKNPADFVRLAQAMPNYAFVAAGAGLDAASMRSRWKVEAPLNLTFLGEISRGEVQDALAACSALVITSLWEGLPTVALEAMVHGVPVVVSNNPGCMEAIGDGEFGFIYSQGDVGDLAAVTVDALHKDRSALRSAERIADEYDWRVVAPKLDAIYRGAAS